MKRKIKEIIKKATSGALRLKIRTYQKAFDRMSIWDTLFKYHCYYDKLPGSLSSANLMAKIIGRSDICLAHGFIYTYDPTKTRLVRAGVEPLTSITPDYALIINSDLREIMRSLPERSGDNSDFIGTLHIVTKAIEDKARAISEQRYEDVRYEAMAKRLPDLLYRDCQSLVEAIQKILFYNGLLWQVGHRHVGLGRMDLVLYPYYKKDVEANRLNYEQAKGLLKEMCLLLGKDSPMKSLNLIGDSGQYIILGGVDKNGKNTDNELTRMFLELFEELRIPDPKLIFRVNEETPMDTWKRSIRCLANGCGSPLFMNETLIMENMVKFGYRNEDVWNVGTSACWEPLIIGKSSDQNNPFISILACNALKKALTEMEDELDYGGLLQLVKRNLAEETRSVVVDKDYDYSPIMSLFNESCIRSGKDFAHQGSDYMYQGAQLLGLPNLVNSLLNIKKYVYEQGLVSLVICREIVQTDYENHLDIKQLFKSANDKKFGLCDEYVLRLSQELIGTVSETIGKLTANGYNVKFGLSSPSYISRGKVASATLDGRNAGEPFAVHISPLSSTIDIAEVLDFASSLSYPVNCLNGNVVDYVIPPVYLNNSDKLVPILRDAFKKGLYQLQLNVYDRATLIDAKLHPEKYPTLVVRVWGFSAYFNDLPEEYKDNLIARAGEYERA